MIFKTNLMKIFIIFLLFFIGISGEAQTTAIPDPNFEQALIDLGIDSDETVNGQVLTVDIAGVTALDISEHYYIEDLTGIEDFSALKILDISFTGLYGNDLSSNTLNLTTLHNLEEVYMNSGGDAISVLVEHLNLSNNPNLKIIHADDVWPLLSINLENSDLQLNNLDLQASKYFDENPGSICITVTNPTEAQNGQGIYATWNVCCNLVYSSDCNLGTLAFMKKEIQLFPNPITEIFKVNSQQDIEKINIYDLHGKLVKRFTQVQKNYSVADMPAGIYIVEVLNLTGSKQVIKLVKK